MNIYKKLVDHSDDLCKTYKFSFNFMHKKFYSSVKNDIQNYNPEKDGTEVREIALQNMQRLVSVDGRYTKDRNLELFKFEILPALEDQNVTKKVLRLNDKTVGFVTYRTEKCWYGTDAKIEHLAVNQTHQSKGYGGELLGYVLKDLEKEKVEFVYLNITTSDLTKFYNRNNFKVIKHVNHKYLSSGCMALKLKKQKDSLAVQCFDFIRMRKTLFPQYGYGLLVFGVVGAVVFNFATDVPAHSSTKIVEEK